MEPSAFPQHSPQKDETNMGTQTEKALAFRALHQREKAFIIRNPWDAGTARLLAHLGFEALATTSAGYAFSVGRRDNSINRDETLAHVAAIASATAAAVRSICCCRPISSGFNSGVKAIPTASALPFGGAASGPTVKTT